MKVSLCYKCPECGNFISTDQQWVGGGGNLLIVPDCRSTQRVQIYAIQCVCRPHANQASATFIRLPYLRLDLTTPLHTWGVHSLVLTVCNASCRCNPSPRHENIKSFGQNCQIRAPKHCANTLPSWRGTGRYFGQTLRCKINTEKLIIFLQIIV